MQENMLPITRPDPIRTRDRLRMLPRSGEALQQTIQYLTRAAQGGVREVEPYIALSELNEIKRDIEQQKSTQATAGETTPMTQSLPEQVKQSAGIAGLQGARQQKSAQDMAQSAAQSIGPVPDGTPQPVPPQEQKEGLMSLPAGNSLDFRSGGIISFAEPTEENNNSTVTDPDVTENDEGEVVAGYDLDKINETSGALRGQLKNLETRITGRANTAAPRATTDLETEMELAKKYPDRFGILNTPAGQGQLERLDAQQKLARDEMGLRRQENRPSLGQALIAGAENSRGQKGFANFGAILGGIGKNAAEQRAGVLKIEQALRKEDLGLSEARMLAENKIQDLQRAKAEGDANKEAKARMDLAKIAKDYGISINTLLGKEYQGVLGYLGRTDSAAIAADARVQAAEAAAANGGDKIKIAEQLGQARRQLIGMTPGTPEYARQQAVIEALAQTLRESKTSDVGANRMTLSRESNLYKESAKIQDGMKRVLNSGAYLDAKSLNTPDGDARAAAIYDAELTRLRALYPTETPANPLGPANPAAPAPAPAVNPALNNPTPLPPGLEGGKAALVNGQVYIVPRPENPSVTVNARWDATTKRFIPIK